MIQLESVLLSNAKLDTFIPSKVFISFVELSVFVLFTVHVVKNVQVTSTSSPQIHFITKHILFLKTISSIIVTRSNSAYNMFNRYHHAYQINQENVHKSLFKTLFIVMKF